MSACLCLARRAVSTGRLLLVLGALVGLSTPAPAQQPPARRAVLVTGASTGIGRAIAERLAGEGLFRVRRSAKAGGNRRTQPHSEHAGRPARCHRRCRPCRCRGPDRTRGARAHGRREQRRCGRRRTAHRDGRGRPALPVRRERLRAVPRDQGVRPAAHRVPRTGGEHQLHLRHPLGSAARRVQHEQARARGVRRRTGRGAGARSACA